MLIINFIKENMINFQLKVGCKPICYSSLLKNGDLDRLLGQPTQHLRSLAHWELPPASWMVLNFDGSSKGNLSLAGAVGVVRDHMGRIKLIVVEPLGWKTTHFSKAQAMYISLINIGQLNCNNLMIKGDSLNIIQML